MRISIVFSLLFILFPTVLFATDDTWVVSLLSNSLTLIPQITTLLVAITLLVFVWGLTVFVRNAGDEKKLAEGKKFMVWGVIALTVIVSVWGIVGIMQIMTGTGGIAPQAVPQVNDPF